MKVIYWKANATVKISEDFLTKEGRVEEINGDLITFRIPNEMPKKADHEVELNIISVIREEDYISIISLLQKKVTEIVTEGNEKKDFVIIEVNGPTMAVIWENGEWENYDPNEKTDAVN